jgi:hypothetical protein
LIYLLDWANFAALCVASVAAWTASRRVDSGDRPTWQLASVGLALLAIDERLSLHERLGWWADDIGMQTPAGFNHLDDVFVVIAACVAAVFLARHWRALGRVRGSAVGFAAALVLGAGAVAWDAAGPVEVDLPEELLELGASIAAATGAAVAAGWLASSSRELVGAESSTAEAPVG